AGGDRRVHHGDRRDVVRGEAQAPDGGARDARTPPAGARRLTAPCGGHAVAGSGGAGRALRTARSASRSRCLATAAASSNGSESVKKIGAPSGGRTCTRIALAPRDLYGPAP